MPENQPEKVFVDRFDAQTAPPGVIMTLTSGGKKYSFILDWALAKKLGKYLKQTIEEVEAKSKFTFDDRLDNEPVKSNWVDPSDLPKK